jgi:hypothetical protein
MRKIFRPLGMVSIVCIALLCAGFYASWIKLWGDQNWFARSGGLVAFIAGSWLVAVTTRRRQEIELMLKKEGGLIATWEAVIRDLVAAIDDHDLRRDLRSEISGKMPEKGREIVNEFISKSELQTRQLRWMGIGTLVWTLGDLIQFWPR